MARILIYETESPATMVKSEVLIKGLFGMKGGNEGGGYRFSMNTFTGFWSFENPVINLLAGRKVEVSDEGKAQEVAEMLFERFNTRAKSGQEYRSNSFPRLFQTELLKLETCVPYISPSLREQQAWDLTYRIEVRPDSDSEPVRVENWQLFMRITMQGVLQAIHYNLLPVKREEQVERLIVSNGVEDTTGNIPQSTPSVVFKYAKGRLAPYYLHGSNANAGGFSLYYPASAESPELPSIVINKESPKGEAQVSPPPEPVMGEGNMNFTLFVEPYKDFVWPNPDNVISIVDGFIYNVENVWKDFIYVGKNGNVPISVTITPAVIGQKWSKSNPNHIMIHVGTVAQGIRITHTPFDTPGSKEAWFLFNDLNSSNTPAHEFGHMLGLEDRYHNFQEYTLSGGYSIRGINGSSIFLDDQNNVQPANTSFVTLPMLLPYEYDSTYNFRDNLMSDPNSGSSLSNLQLRIAINHYNGRKETESLPVEQFTLLSDISSSQFDSDYSRAGVGLFQKSSAGGTLEFLTVGVSTPKQADSEAFVRIVYGDIPNSLPPLLQADTVNHPFNRNPVQYYEDRPSPYKRSNLFYIVPRSSYYISKSKKRNNTVVELMRDREQHYYLEDPYKELE